MVLHYRTAATCEPERIVKGLRVAVQATLWCLARDSTRRRFLQISDGEGLQENWLPS